ncbi:MAG TPA: S16 family serine protease, partial [Candidatus Nitrosotenuis sp.]|nr:S16 family serine protease [Candidatus Nitrosotenuis sp.]
GIKTVIIPIDNQKDLADIPDNVKKGIQIIPVATIDEVLKVSLTQPLKPIEWMEPSLSTSNSTTSEASGENLPTLQADKGFH